MSTQAAIKGTEFERRRRNLLKGLRGSVGLVFAGTGGGELRGGWRPDPGFEYLTGITDEPGAAILFDPSNRIESKQVTLFLRPLDPEVEKWDGARAPIDSELVKRYGIRSIVRTGRLPAMLATAVRRDKRMACLHQFATHDQPVSPDLEVFRKVAERVPGSTIEDRTELLARLRAVKSPAEQACIREAGRITALGFDEVLATMRPGMNEFEVQETLEHAYRSNGSRGPAYNTIAGSGFNGTVLHYGANDQPMQDGDLVVIDSGADYMGYAADVTRTFPVGGRFSKRQRELYSIVLKALDAAIARVRAGCTFQQIDKAARDIIVRAGHGDHFFHGIGHHLGLEVHDITPDQPLKQGAVITVEPGIYIAEERLGIRIEDDVVVTRDGCINLTRSIPRSIAAIERRMKGGR
ncbi:MAG: Xaa-Pro peptidase family protein [Planctomycetota bacterium]|nr:Xaa-Pro peptidase family protein [Planctomycetota bacterium]MEC9157461.1 Xaa-Pro peptidase family protein [Planctomycetota bacterium]MEC9234541.1 Xaa-Pro peptidase family protein [Planctomycetota bacterium]MED5506844.1 Xaa-Pro peptidase family protein [Planctomycetota bacterium]